MARPAAPPGRREASAPQSSESLLARPGILRRVARRTVMWRVALGRHDPRPLLLCVGAGAALFVAGIGALWLWNVNVAATTRQRVFWLVPEEHRGWVQVRFGAPPGPDCPPLIVNGHNFVIRVPATGELCTSTPLSVLPKSPHIFMRIPAGAGSTEAFGRSPDPPEWVSSLATSESTIRFFVSAPNDQGRTGAMPTRHLQ